MTGFRRATLRKKAARRYCWGRMAVTAALCSLAGLGGLAMGAYSKPRGEPPAALLAAEEPGWLIEDGRLALALGPGGKLEPIRGETFYRSAAIEPRPFATQPALAAMAVQGHRLVLAVNRLGLYALEISEGRGGEQGGKQSAGSGASEGGPERRALVSGLASPAGAFPSRSVSRFWRFADALRLFLYRHPYFESDAPSGASHYFLELASENSMEAVEQAASLGQALGGDADIYAIYPLRQGRLVYQTRDERGERLLSAYGSYDEGAGAAMPLSKQSFEAALQPLPLARAPKELQAMARLVPGDIVIELAGADASTQSYYRGSMADSMQAWARIGADGAILAAADGRGAYLPAADRSAAAEPRAFDLSAKLGWPGMRFREPVLFSGFAACIWEEELFPLLGRSGILLADCRGLGL